MMAQPPSFYTVSNLTFIGLLQLRHYILFTYTFQVKSTKNVDNVKTDKSFSDLSVFLLILFQITIHSYPTGVKFFTALFLPNID